MSALINVINMMELRSEDIDVLEFVEKQSYSRMTLDIETLDHDDVKNEPIISFSLSFVQDLPLPIVQHFPTFAFLVTDRKDEKDLLLKLRGILAVAPKSTKIVGHNVSYEIESKKLEGWSSYRGYDVPKILDRGNALGLGMDVIREFKTDDTMDIAYSKFDHGEHGLLDRNGNVKKLLKCEEIEGFFNIKRSTPKLGQKVREYFEQKRFKEIMLYNSCDTISESIIYRILDHKLNHCKQPLISFKKNCEHIPTIISIEEMETWKRLKFQS